MDDQTKKAFKESWDNAVNESNKTLNITNIDEAKAKIGDIEVFGDGNLFQLLSKASSKAQGWMKSTKAMQIQPTGCVVQVTTQQGQNVSEALVFVPDVVIATDTKGNKYLTSFVLEETKAKEKSIMDILADRMFAIETHFSLTSNKYPQVTCIYLIEKDFDRLMEQQKEIDGFEELSYTIVRSTDVDYLHHIFDKEGNPLTFMGVPLEISDRVSGLDIRQVNGQLTFEELY